MLGRPGREGKCGATQDILNGVRRRARLLGVVGQRAEHPVGDILGNTLRDQGLATLLRRNFLPRKFLSDGLADETDLVALSKRLRAGK